MRPINVTLDRLPHIVGILRQKYPQEPVMGRSRLEIHFDKDGQALDSAPALFEWDYKTHTSVPVVQTGYKKDNFTFVQAMKVVSVDRASYIKVSVTLEDLDGNNHWIPKSRTKELFENIYGGWIIGQFKFMKYYSGIYIEPIKYLWDEAHKI